MSALAAAPRIETCIETRIPARIEPFPAKHRATRLTAHVIAHFAAIATRYFSGVPPSSSQVPLGIVLKSPLS